MAGAFKYSNRPVNPARFALAVWRAMKDIENTEEVAILEMTFNRSWWGKKLARWDAVAAALLEDHPEVEPVMAARQRLPAISIEELSAQPDGSLGAILAGDFQAQGLNPNLVDPLPGDTDGEWLMAHTYETHDFWHVITGFNQDLQGEVGLGGFYAGQMPNNTFMGFMLGMIMARCVLISPTEQGGILKSLTRGFIMGQNSRCLVGLDWPSLWHRDVDELRREFNISGVPKLEPLVQVA